MSAQVSGAQAARKENTPTPLLTLEEVAAYLRVSPATVRRWTNAGKLPCYRLGGNRERKFLREAVLAFVAQGAQQANASPPK